MRISPYLYAPDSYLRALPDVVAKIVNGCGPGGWKVDLVPDTILLLNITVERWLWGIHPAPRSATGELDTMKTSLLPIIVASVLLVTGCATAPETVHTKVSEIHAKADRLGMISGKVIKRVGPLVTAGVCLTSPIYLLCACQGRVQRRSGRD